MHISQIYDALPQLIISSFAFATCYTAFYLTMAKVEHIEIEKTKREKELSVMKKNNSSDEEIQSKKQEIESCCQKINEILSDMNNNQNFNGNVRPLFENDFNNTTNSMETYNPNYQNFQNMLVHLKFLKTS